MQTKRSAFLLPVAVYLVFLTTTVFAAPDVIGLRPVVSSLNNPVYMTHAGDGSNRMFIVEQRGKIKVLQPGALAPTIFLDVTPLVSSDGGERGLLGLAFHPQYSTNHRFFIFYTRRTDGAVEIAEYQTSDGNPDLANPSPVRTIITIPHEVPNHNGGTILFGPDGFLYAGIGDGTGGNDSANNAQNLSTLLGKFIRIDVNTPVGQVPAYNIPRTNPFVRTLEGRPEIWALGLRNPYRFSFDRGGTHQLWAADVGQEVIEEVNVINRAGNYGWRVYEGNACTGLDPSLCIPSNYIPPVFQYSSGEDSSRCSVTGGFVYRGTLGTFAQGAYVYADFCTGEIMNWLGSDQLVRIDTARLPTAIAEDEKGELFIVSLTGTVEQLIRRKTTSDFDGDLRSDVSVFRPSIGTWFVLNSSNSAARTQGFGLSRDVPTPEDFDGDLVTDISVFRPSTGTWYYLRSTDGTVGIFNFGANGDIPAPADYDGDLKADLSVFRPDAGTWYVYSSKTNSPYQRTFGTIGDVPVVGDYDGDGRSDMAIWRASTGVWYWGNAFDMSIAQRQFGIDGDVPTQGDFDGDSRTDVAVFRPSDGAWYTTHSLGGAIYYTRWGTQGDDPVVGDYDGDGLDDIAVFRPSSGVWYTLLSSDKSSVYTQFGKSGDVAVVGRKARNIDLIRAPVIKSEETN